MKKNILIILIFLITGILFSFTTNSSDRDEVTITVTADKETKFDMFQSGANIATQRGLTTPYKLSVRTTDTKFIFKSQKLKPLKVNVERLNNKNGNKASLFAGWPITVLLIKDDTMTAFGID
jgi:hypothetical protein